VKEQTISFEGNLWIEVIPNHEHDPSAPSVGVAHVDSAEFGGDGVKLRLRYEEVPSDASRKPRSQQEASAEEDVRQAGPAEEACGEGEEVVHATDQPDAYPFRCITLPPGISAPEGDRFVNFGTLVEPPTGAFGAPDLTVVVCSLKDPGGDGVSELPVPGGVRAEGGGGRRSPRRARDRAPRA
jgi:hypothetical protein